jgi:hypothetical protein
MFIFCFCCTLPSSIRLRLLVPRTTIKKRERIRRHSAFVHPQLLSSPVVDPSHGHTANTTHNNDPRPEQIIQSSLVARNNCGHSDGQFIACNQQRQTTNTVRARPQKMRVERKGRRRKKKKQRMETLLDRCLLADPDVAEGETRSPSDRVVQTKLCPAPTPPQNLFDWCERTELMS